MKLTDLWIGELAQEAASTRRVLERVPENKLAWAPHPKSMTLGQLALHVAVIPGALAEFLNDLIREAPSSQRAPEPASLAEILTAFDSSVEAAKLKLSSWGEDDLMAEWKMISGTETIIALPRVGMARSVMFNHLYHHRGQLTVYLRLLDVPVPSVYGPSADENPFG
ncbi:DinB family protein [Paenibacillus sp. sptzw28]|nr:DinB family protein [Paenibacillus sp. sptzw28]